MTKYKEWPIEPGTVDVLVGGTPCTSFSVAGLRKGLDDPRGKLMLVYLGLAEHLRVPWLVWENVPGVLSSSGGRDFGAFLGALAQLGYGFAYRVLDAQYFGVAQRRRRVFLVARRAGDWRRAAAVLFERHSLSGHPAPRREARKEAVRVAPAGARGDGANRGSHGDDPALAFNTYERRLKPVADPIMTNMAVSEKGVLCFSSKDDGQDAGPLSPTLRSGNNANSNANGGVAPAVFLPAATPVGFDSYNLCETGDVNQKLKSPSGGVTESIGAVMQAMVVRRLTPVECERLQGFPDNYTQIPYRDKPAADGPRYKALGNSMAVPVMRWIGQRIALVDSIR